MLIMRGEEDAIMRRLLASGPGGHESKREERRRVVARVRLVLSNLKSYPNTHKPRNASSSRRLNNTRTRRRPLVGDWDAHTAMECLRDGCHLAVVSGAAVGILRRLIAVADAFGRVAFGCKPFQSCSRPVVPVPQSVQMDHFAVRKRFEHLAAHVGRDLAPVP